MIVGIGLKSKFVLQGLGEGGNHVDGGNLGQQILLLGFGSLFNVDPDVSGQVPRLHGEGGP